MALSTKVVNAKFVKTPTSHLCCAICEKVFVDPVINVACGHSFCRQCLDLQLSSDSTFKCPVDNVDSNVDQKTFVINRSLQDQVNDLDVYCSFGWIWSEDTKDFVQDPNGCCETVKYGGLQDHEENCGYAVVSCPNGGAKCGTLQRRDFNKHVAVCLHQRCPNQIYGCQFSGCAEEGELHRNSCNFKCQANKTIEVQQRFNELLMSNRALESRLKETEEKVDVLTLAKANLEEQVKKCHSKILELSERQRKLEEIVGQLAPNCNLGVANGLRHVPSLPNTSVRSSSTSGAHDVISRPWVRNSLPSNYSDTFQPKNESWVMPFQFKCIGTLRSHLTGVSCVQTWKNKMYSCGADGVIKVWDLENLVQGCKKTISSHTQRIQALAFGHQLLYSAGEDLSIKSYRLDSLELHTSVETAHEKCITGLLCTENFLFSSSYTVIKVWKCQNLCHVHSITGLYHWVRALACCPSNDKIYSGSHGNIDIWNPKPEFNLLGKITHSHGSIHSMAITSRYIIIGTYNQNIHVYDVRTNEYLRKLTGHVGVINCLVTSISGNFMFTGSSDSTVQIWSLEKMLPIQSLQRHNDGVNALCINGDLLVTGSEDSEIKVFKHFRMQMGFVPS